MATAPPSPRVVLTRDPFGAGVGWHTRAGDVSGYLLAPHHAARCVCGDRRHHVSPLCWSCHVSIFRESLL